MLEKLGGTPVATASGEIKAALESGALDAAQWAGPHDDERLDVHKVAPNYYFPGWQQGSNALHIVVNQSKWDDLPASYKAVLTAAAALAGGSLQAKYDARNPEALKKLVVDGVKLKPFSGEIMDAASAAANAVYAELAADHELFARILGTTWPFATRNISGSKSARSPTTTTSCARAPKANPTNPKFIALALKFSRRRACSCRTVARSNDFSAAGRSVRRRNEETIMKYMLLIYRDKAKFNPGKTSGDHSAPYIAYAQALAKAGVIVGGDRLQPATMASTVRVTEAGTKVLDGPYADTKEQLGGYYMIDVPDLDAALQWAARCPGARKAPSRCGPSGGM